MAAVTTLKQPQTMRSGSEPARTGGRPCRCRGVCASPPACGDEEEGPAPGDDAEEPAFAMAYGLDASEGGTAREGSD